MDRGFSVIAFPCNQFGGQEPEVCPRIKAFATEKYRVQFPMMDKIEVNGENISPVYAAIKSVIPGNIKWNFEKVRSFLTPGNSPAPTLGSTRASLFMFSICFRLTSLPLPSFANPTRLF